MNARTILLCILTLCATGAQGADAPGLPRLPAGYGEEVVLFPSTGKPPVLLEMSIYKPPGPGPFPVFVMNHGKDSTTDAHKQERFQPWGQVREFVMRGYLVAAPNRRGFANSGGTYALRDCNVTADGLRQREDVEAAIEYLQKRPEVDPRRILVGGASQGGWVSIAYAQVAPPGVVGILNFNGGSRQVKCPGWENNIIRAFADYGRNARVPSLWLYGDNDVFWSKDLIRQMFDAYRRAGAQAEFVDIGNFKEDAHKLVGDPDGLRLWWPPVEHFLVRLGLPVDIQYQPAESVLPASNYAAIDDVAAVPYLDEKGREAYRNFIRKGNPRVFAISTGGRWSFASGGGDPLGRALQGCAKNNGAPCMAYAIDDDVVWKEPVLRGAVSVRTIPPSSGYAQIDDIAAVPYLKDRGRETYREFLTHPGPRAFVIVPDGSFTIAYGGRDPLNAALQSCRVRHAQACEAYAVDDRVVWKQ